MREREWLREQEVNLERAREEELERKSWDRNLKRKNNCEREREGLRDWEIKGVWKGGKLEIEQEIAIEQEWVEERTYGTWMGERGIVEEILIGWEKLRER